MSTGINVAHRIDDGKDAHACPACGDKQGIPKHGLMTRSRVVKRVLKVRVRGLCWSCGTISELPDLSVADVFGD
ncbi:MAG: hypothetical protein AAFQ07_12050 [Chloroflexota bacterium]